MPNKLTIVFRGLLVFHKLSITGQPSIFEIGILPEPLMIPDDTNAADLPANILINPPEHVPRIMTIRNGVLESTFLLQEFIDDPKFQGVWKLDVGSMSSGTGVTTRPSNASGDTVDRIKTDPKSD